MVSRSRARGDKVFIPQYRIGGRGTPTKRYTIGRLGVPWTAETARREARRLLGLVAAGHDPGVDRRREEAVARALTVAKLAERFLAEHAEAKRKPRTAAEYRRLMQRHVLPAFGSILIKDLGRADVARLHHAGRATPYQANRVLAVVS